MKDHSVRNFGAANRPGRLVCRMVLLYSLIHALINVLWLAKRGGKGDAARAAMLGAGLPAVAEVWITSVGKLLTHRMSSKVLGVPLAIPLLWFNVVFGSLATIEKTLEKLGFPDEEVEKLSAAATASMATSLDLILDGFGLETGLWKWEFGGPYARDIRGVNGERGIPILNFVGWLTLVFSVVHLFQKSSRKLNSESEPPGDTLGKVVVLALVPYYLVSVSWAIRTRRLRFVLYSLVFPAVLSFLLRREED